MHQNLSHPNQAENLAWQNSSASKAPHLSYQKRLKGLWTESWYPLQESQHAYQNGKSTETAPHLFVIKIECSNAEDPGCLNGHPRGIWFDRICDNSGSPRKLWCTWNTNNVPRIHFTYEGESIEAKVGCPLGGVLATLLWCMVVHNWLLKLNSIGYTAQVYANDLVIVTRRKST